MGQELSYFGNGAPEERDDRKTRTPGDGLLELRRLHKTQSGLDRGKPKADASIAIALMPDPTEGRSASKTLGVPLVPGSPDAPISGSQIYAAYGGCEMKGRGQILRGGRPIGKVFVSPFSHFARAQLRCYKHGTGCSRWVDLGTVPHVINLRRWIACQDFYEDTESHLKVVRIANPEHPSETLRSS